ncbi:MAG: cyanophycinase [Bacteroidetes bacterium]|nr:cyanophycinase [Bacteroidota bacterium]
MQQPKGILVPVGGAEDKGTDLEAGIIERNRLHFFEIGILKRIAELLPTQDSVIEVITTASSIPDEIGENYREAFAKLGYPNVGHMRIRNREDVAEYIPRLQKCQAILFSGGNQLRLSSIFGGTDFLDILQTRYQNERLIIAGTSAGAMAMSNNMIYEGNAGRAHLKGEVRMTSGLGLLNGVIVDSHFDKRGRFARLAQAVAANPGAIGIGLGEDTGVIVRNGEDIEAIGSGAVTIVDGRHILHNNIADIEFGMPISVEGLVVHILSMGNTYNFKTRVFSEGNVPVPVGHPLE